jgi:hypothetical protein
MIIYSIYSWLPSILETFPHPQPEDMPNHGDRGGWKERHKGPKVTNPLCTNIAANYISHIPWAYSG